MSESLSLGRYQKESPNLTGGETIGDYSKFERELSLDESEMLELANSIILSELKKLDVDSTKVTRIFPFPVPANSVRIASDAHPVMKNNPGGHLNLVGGKILVSALESEHHAKDLSPNARKLIKFRTMLHEAVHVSGVSTRGTDPNSEGVVRVGYLLKNKNGDIEHEHLRGFNEAVVEHLSELWSHLHKTEIKELLGVTDADFEEVWEKAQSYQTERGVLMTIAEKISVTKNEDLLAVHKRLARGHWTAEMMHMRDIDEAFGKGSLRTLAAMGSVSDPNWNKADRAGHTGNVARALSAEERTEYQKDEAARRVLPQEEWVLYLKRKYEHEIDQALINVADIPDKLPQDDERRIALEKAYSTSAKIAGEAHDAYKYAEKKVEQKVPQKYPIAYLKLLDEYAHRKRMLVWEECERFGVFGRD